MASALLRRLRKRRDLSPDKIASLPTPLAGPVDHIAQELQRDVDASRAAPPRSYAQLSDVAHELVAASWDPALPVRYWLSAVRELQHEAEESVVRNDPETAFVRADTVLRLLRDALPYHHQEWHSLAPEELGIVESQVTAVASLHSSLRAFLLDRTAKYNARITSISSTTASPALMLRNTISAAADSYVDSTALGRSRDLTTSDAQGPASFGPPRVNKLRSAYVASTSSDGFVASAMALPAPGDEEDLSLPISALSPLTSRQDGRRIPRLDETISPVLPFRPAGYVVQAASSAPLPLPGEDDSDEEFARVEVFASPIASGPILHAYPTPPVPPTPPPSVLRRLAETASSAPASAEVFAVPMPTEVLPAVETPAVAPCKGREQISSLAVVAPPTEDQATVPSNIPLRAVLLPLQLIRAFVDEIAVANTRNAIETCGLLLGGKENNKFRITHLLVPKQTGTSESCSMANEEDVAAAQQRFGLLTLGWIHTHPTQSIFLSSVDLHTHASYQMLLREAIAVVCAPHEGPDAFGVFRLTDPPGMGTILACHDQDTFHPHPPLPLYTDVDQEGGHCQVREELPFELIDLR